MKNHTCNVCGQALAMEHNTHRVYLSWPIPNSKQYDGRTLRANVEVKFRVTASVYMLDDITEDTDICLACIKKYLPKELTVR